ncbi:MAG: mechanosensitive ion channel domain-containing protein [Pseudomonadota bacterium]
MKRLLLAVLFLISALPAFAQSTIEEDVARWSLQLSEIEARLGSLEPTIDDLDDFRNQLDDVSDELKARIANREEELAPLEAGLEQLGPEPEDGSRESPQVVEERKRLSDRVATLSGGLRLAQNLLLNVDETLTRIVTTRRDMFRDALLTRTRGIFEPGILSRAHEALTRKVNQVQSEVRTRLESSDQTTGDKIRRGLGALFLIGVLILIFRTKDTAIAWLKSRMETGETRLRNVNLSIALTLVRLILPTAAIILFGLWMESSVLIGPLSRAILDGLAYSALLVVGAYGLGSAFFAPYEPELRISRLEDDRARSMHRWLMVLALIVGADRLLVAQGAEGLGLSFETLVTLNTLILIPGGLTLWMASGILRPGEMSWQVEPEDEDDEPVQPKFTAQFIRLLKFIVRAAAVAAPILAMIGYFAASRYIFYSVVFSGAALSIGIMLFHAVNEAVTTVVDEDDETSRRRLRLIPVIVAFFMACAAIPVLLLIWGATGKDLENLWEGIEEGLVIGDIVLSPLDLVSFLIVFSIGYVFTRMLQGIMSRNVLPLTGLDSGGRDAVTAGIGYVGIFAAALIAISTTGLDLSNLAIVAGALSVGIGFGLQNIVNNFVSGVILLIERPIKAGDWVELASGMGYVRKVNVRSTEVQTFDRSTLFVPNSELISSPVINWTHSDLNGRLIVKIGVAYGTDPRKVEAILQEIADSHTMLLKRPAPYVLFRGFGADSLDFEIRGVLRDVNWILNVQSDMNYAIAEKFEEAGIEIPFAQRDVHIKNLDDLGKGVVEVAKDAVEDAKHPPAPRTAPKAGMDTADGEAE